MKNVPSGLNRAAAVILAMAWLLGAPSLWSQAVPPAAPGAPAAPAAPATDLGPLNMEQEVQTLYQDAFTNFNLGKYDVAIQKLGAVHAKTNNKDFPHVMFLEGASYFMMEQYDQAVTILQKYVDTYPKVERPATPEDNSKNDMLTDVTVNLGRSYLKKGDETKGIAVLNKAVGDFPTRRGEIGLTIAMHHKGKGNMDDALRILENITKDAVMSPEMVQSFLMLAEIYTSKGETDKAGVVMEKLKGSAADDDTIIQRNLLGLKIGDEMRQKQLYKEALTAYQNVRKQSEIIRIQKFRVERIEGWIKDVDAGKKVSFLGKSVGKGDLESMLEANKKILGEIELNKTFDAEVYFRLGQCFYEMQRYYEAIAALTEVFDKFPEYVSREVALYCMLLANQALQREGRAYELCELYIKNYPEGQFITNVTDLMGILAYKSGRIKDAILVLQRARDAAKEPADKQRIGFLLGVVLFESQKFDESRDAFMTLIKDDPKSAFKDDAEYRIALTHFFQNDSVKSRRTLREYIASNPKGQYIVDAQYRLAFMEYQAASTNQGGDMAKARDILEKLASDNPNDPNIGQVWSLLGDIYGRLQPTEKDKTDYPGLSLKAYLAAVDKAKSNDVLEYAIEAASNILESEGKWPELANLWQTYYTTHKDGPNALKSIYKIAVAYRRQNKPQEAQKLMADHIAPSLGDPKNEQVEMLIQQLVGMLVPKRRGRAPTAAAQPAATAPAPATTEQAPPPPAAATPSEPAAAATAATPAPAAATPGEPAATAATPPPAAAAPAPAPAAPVQTFEELEEQLKKLLTGPEGEKSIVNGTAQARVLYARALLARMMRDVQKYESLLSIIPDAAKPDELSPLLLATLGDMLFVKGEHDKAKEYYDRLREAFSASEFGDKAPVGLGRIEFAKKNYKEALELFNEAIEKFQGASSVLEATMGKAECHLELGELPKAEKIYKTIESTREWRGAATASAIYYQGLIEEKRKDWAKACTQFRRVILAHQKYKDWLAKSYLHAAQCYLADGKKEDATLVLQQMLARTDVQDQPEFKEAQALLAKSAN